MISTKRRTIALSTVEEKSKKILAGLTDAEKLCIVELYHEFDRIIQIVEGRA
jgi:hypothetical protein